MDDHPVQMQLKDYVVQVVELTANRLIPQTVKACMEEHIKTCPKEYLLSQMNQIDEDVAKNTARINNIEIKLSTLIGLMAGSGLFGGTVSGILVHLLGG